MIRDHDHIFDLLISSIFCVVISLTSVGTALAQAFSCDELRPLRGSELAIEGDLQAEAGFIVKKIIGGEVDLSGTYKYRELFPQIFDGQDLFEIERFYYILCLALSDERIDAERRVILYIQASRERQATLLEAFDHQISSSNDQRQIAAIDWAAGKGNLQLQAIQSGLQSDSPLVQAAAVEAALGTSDVIAGTVKGWNSATASFSIRIFEREKIGNALNFDAQFQGSIFRQTKWREDTRGSLRGNTLSISNVSCSLTASVGNNRAVLEGTLSCEPYLTMAKYPDTGQVIIRLY